MHNQNMKDGLQSFGCNQCCANLLWALAGNIWSARIMIFLQPGMIFSFFAKLMTVKISGRDVYLRTAFIAFPQVVLFHFLMEQVHALTFVKSTF